MRPPPVCKKKLWFGPSASAEAAAAGPSVDVFSHALRPTHNPYPVICPATSRDVARVCSLSTLKASWRALTNDAAARGRPNTTIDDNESLQRGRSSVAARGE